jgi:hypothetical protein
MQRVPFRSSGLCPVPSLLPALQLAAPVSARAGGGSKEECEGRTQTKIQKDLVPGWLACRLRAVVLVCRRSQAGQVGDTANRNDSSDDEESLVEFWTLIITVPQLNNNNNNNN